MREAIFEPFRQVERADRTEKHGSGLGLAIARAYARAHGGDLVYDDASDGARFEVILPGRVGVST
jgi:signal transduction histidine kinase